MTFIQFTNEMEWAKDGDLIEKIEQEGFEMLLTIDKKIKFQQNISKYNIIIVIINTTSSGIQILSKYIPNLFKEIESFKKGNFYYIDL